MHGCNENVLPFLLCCGSISLCLWVDTETDWSLILFNNLVCRSGHKHIHLYVMTSCWNEEIVSTFNLSQAYCNSYKSFKDIYSNFARPLDCGDFNSETMHVHLAKFQPKAFLVALKPISQRMHRVQFVCVCVGSKSKPAVRIAILFLHGAWELNQVLLLRCTLWWHPSASITIRWHCLTQA